jgi:hypothetical protein
VFGKRQFYFQAGARVEHGIGAMMTTFGESEKPSLTLQGTVEKIIPGSSIAPEKAQILVETAEHLYREIRVENVLQDENGNKLGLKPGVQVEVTIEAEKDATVPKTNS